MKLVARVFFLLLCVSRYIYSVMAFLQALKSDLSQSRGENVKVQKALKFLFKAYSRIFDFARVSESFENVLFLPCLTPWRLPAGDVHMALYS